MYIPHRSNKTRGLVFKIIIFYNRNFYRFLQCNIVHFFVQLPDEYGVLPGVGLYPDQQRLLPPLLDSPLDLPFDGLVGRLGLGFFGAGAFPFVIVKIVIHVIDFSV